jgi:hypothetical protein
MKMVSLYGFKFASQFGETPHEDWVTVMAGVTGQQIADGLNRCLAEYPEWPPGAAQFRALCLGLEAKNIDSEGNDATWQLKKYEAQQKRDDEARKRKQLEIPDTGAKERNLKVGNAALKKLRGGLRA